MVSMGNFFILIYSESAILLLHNPEVWKHKTHVFLDQYFYGLMVVAIIALVLSFPYKLD